MNYQKLSGTFIKVAGQSVPVKILESFARSKSVRVKILDFGALRGQECTVSKSQVWVL